MGLNAEIQLKACGLWQAIGKPDRSRHDDELVRSNVILLRDQADDIILLAQRVPL